jgi:hypothetical protein
LATGIVEDNNQLADANGALQQLVRNALVPVREKEDGKASSVDPARKATRAREEANKSIQRAKGLQQPVAADAEDAGDEGDQSSVCGDKHGQEMKSFTRYVNRLVKKLRHFRTLEYLAALRTTKYLLGLHWRRLHDLDGKLAWNKEGQDKLRRGIESQCSESGEIMSSAIIERKAASWQFLKATRCRLIYGIDMIAQDANRIFANLPSGIDFDWNIEWRNIQEELLSRKEFSHLRDVLEHGVNENGNAGDANDATDTLHPARPGSHEHTEHGTSISIPGLEGESVPLLSHEDPGSKGSTNPTVRTGDKTSTENTKVNDAEVMDVKTEAPDMDGHIATSRDQLHEAPGPSPEPHYLAERPLSGVAKARRRTYIEMSRRVLRQKRAGKLSPDVKFSDAASRDEESTMYHETSYLFNASDFVISKNKMKIFMTLSKHVQRLKRSGKLGPDVKLSWSAYEREQEGAMSHEAGLRNTTTSGPQASLSTPSPPGPRSIALRKSKIQEALEAQARKALGAQD